MVGDTSASPTARLYVDTRTQVYDMRPSAELAQAASVKVAVLPRNPDTDDIVTMLRAARADGALIALMTEEDFTGGHGPGEALDGPHITRVRAHAKAIGIAVVCPMRLLLGDGRSVNAAVVIHANGTIATAAHTGYNHYQKQYPVLGWPVGAGARVQVWKRLRAPAGRCSPPLSPPLGKIFTTRVPSAAETLHRAWFIVGAYFGACRMGRSSSFRASLGSRFGE